MLGLRGLYIGLLTGLTILIFSLSFIVKHANWAVIAQEAKNKYLKESLCMNLLGRGSTVSHFAGDDLTYTKRLLIANNLNSSTSEGDEERSSSLCLNLDNHSS